MTIVFFHYASEPYGSLLTRREQGILTREEIKKAEEMAKEYGRIGAYVDHISLFLNPIPSAFLARAFAAGKGEENHRVWYKGSQLYEHIVHIEDIKNPKFELVESFRKTELFDSFCKGRRWDEIPADEKNEYFDLIDKKLIEWGEIGYGSDRLEKLVRTYNRQYPNATEEGYLKAVRRSDFKLNRMKYAANVPHLMIYPEGGRIEVGRINKVVIGSDVRKPFK